MSFFAIKSSVPVEQWKGYGEYIYNRSYLDSEYLSAETIAKLERFNELFNKFVPLLRSKALMKL